MALKNRIMKKIINIPFVLNFVHNFLGANQYKVALYTSVFEGKSGTLLDFGCSYGNTTPGFLNFEYYGVDIDGEAITAAKQKFKNYPHVHFACVDVLRQEYKRNFFDHALFASTSHHLSDEEFKSILDKLLVALKPGGALHFFDIIHRPDDRWTTKLLTKFDQGKHIRTREQTEKVFKNYPVTEMRIFPSPNKFIKLWHFLYIKIVRP